MAGKEIEDAQPQVGLTTLGPDLMLGMWASWMDQVSNTAKKAPDCAGASAFQCDAWT